MTISLNFKAVRKVHNLCKILVKIIVAIIIIHRISRKGKDLLFCQFPNFADRKSKQITNICYHDTIFLIPG